MILIRKYNFKSVGQMCPDDSNACQSTLGGYIMPNDQSRVPVQAVI